MNLIEQQFTSNNNFIKMEGEELEIDSPEVSSLSIFTLSNFELLWTYD